MLRINLQKAVNTEHTPPLASIKKWLNEATKHIPEKITDAQSAIVIRIVSQQESAELNASFRHKTGPTNVLAFPDHPLAELMPETLGDLAVCADIVKQEALEQNKSIEAHWAHLIIHGFLHLLGYDHLTTADANKMETREISILQALGYPNPYKDDTDCPNL